MRERERERSLSYYEIINVYIQICKYFVTVLKNINLFKNYLLTLPFSFLFKISANYPFHSKTYYLIINFFYSYKKFELNFILENIKIDFLIIV